MEAAPAWTALRVVGIDPWEQALTAARRNIADSGIAERVELRLQGVEQIADAVFTVAWLPAPFIAADIVTRTIERTRGALMPGGWLIVGL
jgi:hypothetical protein